MFTSFDKAIVAAVGAVIFVANKFLGVDLGFSAESVQTLITAMTPILVYLVPNKPWSD
jgi:hypothetical protein